MRSRGPIARRGRPGLPPIGNRVQAMSEDWRLRIHLPDGGRGRLLVTSLAAAQLDRELEDSLAERVAVSHDEDDVFVYAATREEAERAGEVASTVAGQKGWEIKTELARWHPRPRSGRTPRSRCPPMQTNWRTSTPSGSSRSVTNSGSTAIRPLRSACTAARERMRSNWRSGCAARTSRACGAGVTSWWARRRGHGRPAGRTDPVPGSRRRRGRNRGNRPGGDRRPAGEPTRRFGGLGI